MKTSRTIIRINSQIKLPNAHAVYPIPVRGVGFVNALPSYTCGDINVIYNIDGEHLDFEDEETKEAWIDDKYPVEFFCVNDATGKITLSNEVEDFTWDSYESDEQGCQKIDLKSMGPISFGDSVSEVLWHSVDTNITDFCHDENDTIWIKDEARDGLDEEWIQELLDER